ncbi:efflux RND transporter permease subunit [Nitrosomonas sp. Nm58]|uniref:efflux RND transporter permease subunit n=1 Tax=Nitrosomonas sp. Nm58 TaxID=200126 RepID=UPI002109B307|nr:efflux RND transporter permease subunit [Nitrosomonas sp. Nm58]
MRIGAIPLVIASGVGSAARQSMGAGMIGGMILAAFVAPIFVPLFFPGSLEICISHP